MYITHNLLSSPLQLTVVTSLLIYRYYTMRYVYPLFVTPKRNHVSLLPTIKGEGVRGPISFQHFCFPSNSHLPSAELLHPPGCEYFLCNIDNSQLDFTSKSRFYPPVSHSQSHYLINQGLQPETISSFPSISQSLVITTSKIYSPHLHCQNASHVITSL